jgi:predicted lipoprotein with Yx(FWY)xxD motif
VSVGVALLAFMSASASAATSRDTSEASAPLNMSFVESSPRPTHVTPKSKLVTYAVTTRRLDSLGRVLVDGKGQTLYVFSRDHHSGHSTCTSECEVQWPPLLLSGGATKPIASGGAKTSLLGTTRLANDALQVTYNGWPLYRFALDTTPGSTAGEGLNNLGGRWYVLSPKGKEIR